MWLASDTFVLASSVRWLASGVGVIDPPPIQSAAAASEQATRAMNSSVVMRARWRVKYAVNGVEGFSPWVNIGEPVSVPAGAVYLDKEFDGEVIDGGPWYVIGGEPIT
jgi:hypothetical protein